MSRTAEDNIYHLVRGAFKVAENHAERVKDLIKDHYPAHAKLNRTSLLMIMKNIRKDFIRDDWFEVKYMFKSIFVYITSEHKTHLHLTQISDLLKSYPEFEDADAVEKNLLLQFRNFFKVACEIIDPKNHKGELLALIGRMCGGVYVPGGGQTTATDRRLLMYERETGIRPRKQLERKRQADDPATLSLAAQHNRRLVAYPTNALPYTPYTVPVAVPVQVAVAEPLPMSASGPLAKRARTEAPYAQNTQDTQNPPNSTQNPQNSANTTQNNIQNLLQSADSFWSYHRTQMESGKDILLEAVPAGQAYSVSAYSAHNPIYNGSAYSYNHNQGPSDAAGHAFPSVSVRLPYEQDALSLRPLAPVSMQMQLPPPPPDRAVQLSLSLRYGGAAQPPAGTVDEPVPGQGQPLQKQPSHPLPYAPLQQPALQEPQHQHQQYHYQNQPRYQPQYQPPYAYQRPLQQHPDPHQVPPSLQTQTHMQMPYRPAPRFSYGAVDFGPDYGGSGGSNGGSYGGYSHYPSSQSYSGHPSQGQGQGLGPIAGPSGAPSAHRGHQTGHQTGHHAVNYHQSYQQQPAGYAYPDQQYMQQYDQQYDQQYGQLGPYGGPGPQRQQRGQFDAPVPERFEQAPELLAPHARASQSYGQGSGLGPHEHEHGTGPGSGLGPGQLAPPPLGQSRAGMMYDPYTAPSEHGLYFGHTSSSSQYYAPQDSSLRGGPVPGPGPGPYYEHQSQGQHQGHEQRQKGPGYHEYPMGRPEHAHQAGHGGYHLTQSQREVLGPYLPQQEQQQQQQQQQHNVQSAHPAHSYDYSEGQDQGPMQTQVQTQIQTPVQAGPSALYVPAPMNVRSILN